MAKMASECEEPVNRCSIQIGGDEIHDQIAVVQEWCDPFKEQLGVMFHHFCDADITEVEGEIRMGSEGQLSALMIRCDLSDLIWSLEDYRECISKDVSIIPAVIPGLDQLTRLVESFQELDSLPWPEVDSVLRHIRGPVQAEEAGDVDEILQNELLDS